MTPAGAESEMQRRLAEMVARLRAVQDELEQDLLPLDSEPEPAAPAPEPLAQALPADARLEAMCGSLLRALRELLSGYEVALAHARPGSGGEAAEVTLAAGPFTGVDVLEEFERAVSELPQVADVTVRGYAGSDRAILEVHLHG